MPGSTVCSFLLMGENSLSKDDAWWHSVRCRLLLPCDANISKCIIEHGQRKGSSIVKSDGSYGSDKMSDDVKCLGLYKVLQSPASEIQDVSADLLKNKQMWRWGTGRWLNTAEELRCNLQVCVRRETRGLSNEQTKLLGDMVQILSFANYVDLAARSLVGMKNRRLNATMRKLEAKMAATVCKMRPAFRGMPLDHVVPNDVPLDLRHKKRGGQGHVATYVILQKIEEFFIRLAEGYKRTKLKVCNS